jgi:hypothetical protein
MKRMVFFFGLLTLLLLAACGGSSGPVKIDSITLSKGDGSGNAGETVTSFSPADHDFHAAVKFENLASGSKVTYIWVAVNAGGATNKTIATVDVNTVLANEGDSDATLPNDWPTGQYRLDVSVNGTVLKSVSFNVA